MEWAMPMPSKLGWTTTAVQRHRTIAVESLGPTITAIVAMAQTPSIRTDKAHGGATTATPRLIF